MGDRTVEADAARRDMLTTQFALQIELVDATVEQPPHQLVRGDALLARLAQRDGISIDIGSVFLAEEDVTAHPLIGVAAALDVLPVFVSSRQIGDGLTKRDILIDIG